MSGVAFLHSDILNVKTKKASHQGSQVGEGRVRDQSQEDGLRKEGFVVCNPPLSFLLFISSSSLWLSASLPCTALSNLSRKQVRQADDETSDCLRGYREGVGGGGRNGGKDRM